MAERKFDEYQKAAINITQNAVVSAGAGSGKTTVLSERFLHLIQEKNLKVEEILTLTFTKKATVEMSSRIYQVLKKKAPEKAAEFYKANIKTLDSYCNSIAKMGARFYGITPDFTQDEKIADKIKEMALPFILKNRDNDALKVLVNSKDYEEKACQIFVYPLINNSTVALPINFEKCLENQIPVITKAWNELGKKTEDTLISMEKAYNSFEGNKKSSYIQSLQNIFTTKIMPSFIEMTREDIEKSATQKFKDLIDYSASIYAISKPSNLKGSEELKELHDILKENHKKLVQLIKYLENFPLLKKLIPLLEEFQTQVNNLKRTSGSLTFNDISSLATMTLKEHPEIRQIEKEKYKAIMIDEFQDNNSSQRDMLFMLAEKIDRHECGVPKVEDLCPDKLFFVGDEKQSIYKFRGADVSVFRALSDDFARGNLSMTTNYRSTPALIASFNTIFGGFPYPPSDDEVIPSPCVFYTELKNQTSVPKYEAVYHKVTMSEESEEKVKNEDPDEIFAPKVHFALYDLQENAESKNDLSLLTENEAEAEWVAEKIKELIHNGRKASDIAVLFRDTKFQPLYERTFLRHGIPYNTEVVTGFFADGPSNDIFALLRLCAYPADTLPFAQILRSPFLNLEIEEIDAILSKTASGTEAFQEDYKDILSSESLKKYENFKNLFTEFKESSRFLNLTQLISKIWYELGYRYETLWNSTVEMYDKMYDLIFELARKSELQNMSLAAFVDSVEVYKDKKLDDMDIPLEQSAGVHLLTIHKSKGLEYPVVFICVTAKETRKDNNSEAVYSSKEYGITLNRPGEGNENYFYNLVKKENETMAAAELRRLVYVALTRAKEEIFITNGKYQPSKCAENFLPGGSKNPDSIFEVLEPVFNYFEGEEDEEAALFDLEHIYAYPRNNELSTTKRKNNKEAKIDFINSLENSNNLLGNSKVLYTEEVKSNYVSPSKLHETNIEEIETNNSAVDSNIPYFEINEIVDKMPKFNFDNFGTIAHAYMEAAIKNLSVPAYPAKEIAGLEDKKEYFQKVKEACTKMQEDFLKTEIAKEVLNSEWKKAEYEFRGLIGKKIVKGIIDLVYKNSDGTYTILDYKTNQEIKPEIYFEQLTCYRKIISDMLEIPEEKIRCKLYYLRYAKVEDITEDCNKIKIEEIINNFQE